MRPSEKPRVAVVGAGAVGVNLALFLDAWGFEVDLIESRSDILLGAPSVSLINHSDGFEYYKAGARRTGEYCIDGSLTKALLYPLSLIDSGICTEENRIRFLVSEGAVATGRISVDGFFDNASHMHRHYGKHFAALTAKCGLSAGDALHHFLFPPDQFMRPLHADEFADANGIVAGAYGAGFGVDMPSYYALLKSALQASNVRQHYNVQVETIARTKDFYTLEHGTGALHASLVFLCGGHSNLKLTSSIDKAIDARTPTGTYYLNAMTFLRLPATSDTTRLAQASRVNFTLMEEFGGMYACIVPPTTISEGLAGIYYPHPTGSQLRKHVVTRSNSSEPISEDWMGLLERGLPLDDPHISTTFERVSALYPFLKGYAEVRNIVCRTVFNAEVADNECGLDRRVRDIAPEAASVTADGRVSAWASPKWTNAELTALLALDHAQTVLGRPALPKSAGGFGPTSLDIASIAKRLPAAAHADEALARSYANEAGFL